MEAATDDESDAPWHSHTNYFACTPHPLSNHGTGPQPIRMQALPAFGSVNDR